MTDHHDNLPAPVDEPIANPGLPAHEPRPTDVDKVAEKRAERQVATFFFLSMACAVLFVVAYYGISLTEESGDNTTFAGLGASHVALGVTLGLALMFIGIGIIQWARKLMADVEIAEMRHPVASSAADRVETLAALNDGLEESGIARRPLVRNSLLGAVGFVGIPLIVSFTDLGPVATPTVRRNTLEKTVWKEGTRVVRDVTGTPIKVEDLEIGDLMNCEPEGLVPVHSEEDEREGVEYLEGAELQSAKAKAALILLRMEPKDQTFSERSPENWSIHGIVAYSKICTHVGCPISLNEQQSHHLLCPCHQSTFDLADGGRVVFGPAARPLPQLPLTVEDGYLVAQSDFREPVGPSYWERDSK
ncbi:MAG: Rieske 2Fe-2S domain-containing protein [Nocardioides sp.]|nr:Rieske 2Fe-2S domain-containing protein [Nocardioides sp.]